MAKSPDSMERCLNTWGFTKELLLLDKVTNTFDYLVAKRDLEVLLKLFLLLTNYLNRMDSHLRSWEWWRPNTKTSFLISLTFLTLILKNSITPDSSSTFSSSVYITVAF